MDRCRCADYEEAVKNLRCYTVGTLRPDYIENYDRTGILVNWVKNGVSSTDLRFSKPKARKVLPWHEHPGNQLSEKARKIEQMWCPYMTPYVANLPED